MCGIAGYYAFGRQRPNKDAVTKMFIETQSRGKDASGFAYINDHEELVVCKQPLEAKHFVREDDWQCLELPKILIMHCRQGTQGKSSDNMNNHPVFTKSGWALIHNGFIRNDHTLFKELPVDRDSEVDSEILVKLLELGGDWDAGMKLINDIRGSLACAAVWKDAPDDLLLFRNSNPIVLAYDKDADILYFGSTKDIVEEGCSSSFSIRGFLFHKKPANITIWDMPKDTGYLISKSGLVQKWDISDTDKSYSYNENAWQQGNSYFPPKDNKETCTVCGKKGLKSYAWINGKVVCHTCRIRS